MPNVHKMSQTPVLESFDLPGNYADPTNAPIPSTDWIAGHAAGLTEGQALVASTQMALSAEIAQCFSDIGFGYAEARVQILNGLKPLFGAIINRLLPRLAEQGLATHIVAILHQTAEQDSGAAIELSVNPDQIDALAGLLPYAIGMPVVLIADPQVGPGQAILRSANVDTLLDIEAVLAGVQTALESIFETADERVKYG